MGAVTRFREQRADPGGQGLGKGSGEGGKQKPPCPRWQSEWQWGWESPWSDQRDRPSCQKRGPAPSKTLLGGSGCAESGKRAIKEGDRVLQPDPCPHSGQRLMDTCDGPGGYFVGRGSSLKCWHQVPV